MNEAKLQIRLLGGHAIQHDGKNITLAMPHKGRALLVYLLLTGRVHSRKHIASLLWPRVAPDKAFRSLRVLLNALRKKHNLASFFKTGRADIEIDSVDKIWCDVLDFQTNAGVQSNHGKRDPLTLQKGIDLYLGKFMLGFDATDTPFDDWLFQQQIALEETALHGLVALIERFDAIDDPGAAIEYAYRLVDIDPWREASYRRLMWVLARSDRADAALFAYEKCREVLQQELAVPPEQETIFLAGQIEQGKIAVVQQALAPALPESSDVPFMAPAVGGPFVGREQVMNRLEAVLSQQNGRFCTCLVGMGGIGKTTIALQLAHKLKSHFSDGVLWADVAQQDTLTIVDRWAAAYGYDLHHVKNERERLIALRSIISEKQALIVVDDVSSAAAVRPLLPETGQCKLLFTSRSEDVARLLDAQPVRVDGLSEENGRSLLSHFISAKRASQEPQAIAAICDLLHDLPLAIVIAGNYLLERQHMRLSDFVGQLETATQKLDIRNANRQVRASFNVSWEALHPEEKQWFRMLGVFNGRYFSKEAFAAVANLNAFTAEAQLQNLVRLSLLSRVENGRFRQHPLLAEFASEKLPKQDIAYGRMIDYFLKYAVENQTNYARLQPEWENLHVGIETAHQHHKWGEVVQFTNALQPPWFAAGRYTEARSAYAFASEAAMYLEDQVELAKIHFRWGQAALEQGDYDRAQVELEKSLEFYEDEKDELGLGNVHYELSRIAINQGAYDQAETLLASSQQIREKHADLSGLAETYYQQARAYNRLSNFELAKKLCCDALDLYEKTKNLLGKIRVLRLMTTLCTMTVDFDSALQNAEKALTLAQTLQDAGEIAMSFYSLSIAHHNIDDLEQALIYADESLNRLKKIGDLNSYAQVLFHKCLVHKAAAEYEQAIEMANEALTYFRRIKDKFHMALVLAHSGDCLEELMQKQAACQNWIEALAIAESIQNRRFIDALQVRLQRC